MTPIVDGLEDEYTDRINVERLNAAQEGQEQFRQYSLRGHPAYVFLDPSGDVRFRLNGRVPRAVLNDLIIRMIEPQPRKGG